ncbi:MAG: hypothetical protein RLZZ450_3093 [Pseudomonadota bacterium]|jgi:hypothetical protein
MRVAQRGERLASPPALSNRDEDSAATLGQIGPAQKKIRAREVGDSTPRVRVATGRGSLREKRCDLETERHPPQSSRTFESVRTCRVSDRYNRTRYGQKSRSFGTFSLSNLLQKSANGLQYEPWQRNRELAQRRTPHRHRAGWSIELTDRSHACPCICQLRSRAKRVCVPQATGAH